jgi:hypothetical protein
VRCVERGNDITLCQLPIGEPVVQHGPFVMTSQAEIQAAFRDYQVCHYMAQPLVELHGGCMVALKVS